MQCDAKYETAQEWQDLTDILSPSSQPLSRWNWISWYQNVSRLDFFGGDNWTHKTCETPVKSPPPTNQPPAFHSQDALPVTQPTVSKH